MNKRTKSFNLFADSPKSLKLLDTWKLSSFPSWDKKTSFTFSKWKKRKKVKWKWFISWFFKAIFMKKKEIERTISISDRKVQKISKMKWWWLAKEKWSTLADREMYWDKVKTRKVVLEENKQWNHQTTTYVEVWSKADKEFQKRWF